MGRAASKHAVFLLGILLSGSVLPSRAGRKDWEKDKDPLAARAAERKRALHALNRLTFGPRPGDVQRVMDMGVDRWIELQLHPEKIDDTSLDARLEPFPTLRMSTRELVENFPDNPLINQVKNGKKPMPSDAGLRMIYRVQLARQEEKKQLREAGKEAKFARAGEASQGMAPGTTGTDSAAGAETSTGNDGMAENPAAAKPTPEEAEQSRLREERLYADLEVQQLPGMPPAQRFSKILGMSPVAQLLFADNIRGGKGQEFLEGLSPRQKDTLLAMNNPGGVVTNELMQAKLLRAIYSERQLDEVMTDFWFNHFNVFVEKGLDRELVTSYERDVIRPRALGKFEDLLVATAKSPAMLFYLDNFMSVGPDSAQALGLPAHPAGPYNRPYDRRRYPQPARPNAGKRPSGLNENYGRELLELHTLSVNGGYSQRDVTEVAKVFTGWTIDKPAENPTFKFDPRIHEPGPKFVLGKKIKFKGEGEGLEVLHRLATSPQTARFISLKLAERFVSDDPPSALVDRMAKTFLKKKGDIREVLTVLFHSPEFWNDGAYRAKVKTPLEFVASAVRATGGDVADAQALTRQLYQMGMPLYGAQPPTGYSMKAETWVSSSALLTRMNFALALTAGKIIGASVDLAPLAGGVGAGSPMPDATETLSTLESVLLEGDVSKQTHDSIAAQQKADGKTIAGLLLGSPEFQRR
jgi:uncharacterized protein (DUF1800 family)